jgi:hypothetical protein
VVGFEKTKSSRLLAATLLGRPGPRARHFRLLLSPAFITLSACLALTLVFGLPSFFALFHPTITSAERQAALTVLKWLLGGWDSGAASRLCQLCLPPSHGARHEKYVRIRPVAWAGRIAPKPPWCTLPSTREAVPAQRRRSRAAGGPCHPPRAAAHHGGGTRRRAATRAGAARRQQEPARGVSASRSCPAVAVGPGRTLRG